MATSPSQNLLAENNYLKAKLKRAEGITALARERAYRIQELEAEIQELMQRSSVADLDSAVGRLRGAHKSEIERLIKEKNEEVERLEARWKKVVKGLQVEIEQLETDGRTGDLEKSKESTEELHGVEDKLSCSDYRYVEVKVHFKVKEELQAETKRREKVEERLKESREEILVLMDRLERLEQNRLVRTGPASNSPGIIREVVREAVDGMRGRSRGSRE